MKKCPTPRCTPRSGFTLLELAVTVIIIAVLAMVALPMYKHAVLKSRFSTVMPAAKAVADAQEVYYLGNNQYALGKEELDVAPVQAENTQVALSTAAEEDKYIYVAAKRSDIPDVRYIMYQKNSPKFAGNIHCEAKADNDEALWLCEKGLHGTEVSGSGSLQGGTYKTFLLAGSQGDSSFLTCPENATCDEGGSVTGCESGYYLEEGACKQEIACSGEKPAERQLCQAKDTCGWEVRTVECDYTTGEWTEPDWNTDGCVASPKSTTRSCSSQDANTCGTQTQAYQCNASGVWVTDGWTGSCASKEATVRSCSCGSSYRSASCQSDGTWKYGSWSSCPSKPNDEDTWNWAEPTCKDTGYAYKYRSVNCQNGSWQTGNWNIVCLPYEEACRRYAGCWWEDGDCTCAGGW